MSVSGCLLKMKAVESRKICGKDCEIPETKKKEMDRILTAVGGGLTARKDVVGLKQRREGGNDEAEPTDRQVGC